MRLFLIMFGLCISFSACSMNDWFSSEDVSYSEESISDAEINVNTHTVEPLNK
jgi:hypothetical protein